jgi:beta-glucanase (GH16 family)
MPDSRTLARLKKAAAGAAFLTFAVAQAAGAASASSSVAGGAVTLSPASSSDMNYLSRPRPKPTATATATKTATASASPTATATNTATTSPTTTTPAVTLTPMPSTAPKYTGWTADWVDDLNIPIDQTKWGRYGWGYQVPGQGAMGRYLQSNTFTSNGIMTLRTQYVNGEWSSAGVSSGDFYSASGGRWEVRAKFPVSKGIGYAFLLYPNDGTWPPEVDLAEGRAKGPLVTATYHWGAANSQVQAFLTNTDMSGWHTYGAIIGTNTITYTFDGKAYATITNSQVTTKKLWIGFQCGAMDPNGSAKAYETVDHGVPGPLTPAVSDIQIDWVAHYTQS